MPHVSEAFPSRFVKAADLGGQEHQVRIANVEYEDIGNPPKRTLVASFHLRTKVLPLNKTNASTIAAVYGDDTAAWLNRDIIIYEAVVDFRGTPTPTIRCRIPRAGTQAQPSVIKPVEPAGSQGATAAAAAIENTTGKVLVMPGTAGGRDDMNDKIPF
jgi:hypothetical protein